MLVSTEPGGLGNRIKSWVSAVRLDPEARVFWPRTPNMPAAFEELFEPGRGIDRVPETGISHCSWRLAVLPEDLAELPEHFATSGGGRHPLIRHAGRLWWKIRGEPDDRYRYMIRAKSFSRRSTRADGRVIDLEYERIPDYFRRVYGPIFETVRPRAEILERVEGFAAEHIDASVVGVQVRTWRDAPRRQRRLYRPAVRRLEALLGAAGPERRFLVVSDDDEVFAWLEGLVGRRRLIAYPRETSRLASWQSLAGISEDLIDMLLLARTNELFASFLSTFSEAAWWLGGARAKVRVF